MDKYLKLNGIEKYDVIQSNIRFHALNINERKECH